MSTKVFLQSKKKFKNPVLLTGLPGIGLVGKICVDYFLKQLKTEKIGEIYSDSFPPSVHTKDALVELIKDELHATEHKGRHFLFLAGPVQPSLDFRSGAIEHYEFAEEIVEAVKKLGVKEVFTLAGLNIGDARMEKQPDVVIAATDKKTLERFTSLGAKADKKEGLISGAAGLILGIAQQQGMQGACLMGETNAKLIYGDHGAAKKLIELIVKAFGFKVEMKGIEREAKNIEKAFEKLAKQFEEAEEKPPKDGPSYVR
ncbi:MAG: PAC2 family protein [Candidatus Diapherotrites archaeon]|uniref:PAC2 family protein n=1 Tax=Candidatus Iainarchaeum sp. TaxID=3101447 RepID=A0A938YNW8_9ARCH|nr:PAC2 family protein [Candidatus Diapherotrites archaeon]